MADNQNESGYVHSGKRTRGIFISHGTGFVLLLLATCLSVLVGLVVHFASPDQLVCKCDITPIKGASPSAEELRRRCLKLIAVGDAEICTKCPGSSTTQHNTSHPVTATTIATTTPAPEINYRLPRAVKPFHYALELQPEIYGTNSSLFTFNGSVVITLNVTESTSNITLHKKDIDINNETLTLRALDNLSRLAPRVVRTTYDDVREFYVLHLDGDLDVGRSYEVGLVFRGKMRTDKMGLYVSSYTADNNDTVYLAATQFEPPATRKAFPCFDEPALKATFDIVLVRKTTTGRDYRTLANTDVVAHEIRGDYTADIFARTPVMSTYLLAFVVCDFDQYENITSNVTYRTIARSSTIQYAGTAHRQGLKLFDWFVKTFDPAYPITKLDNIAIPKMLFGGMENWGLATYYEDLLYTRPGVTTAVQQDSILTLLAHEIGHMWFGDLVSPKWWWWIWLNEGFASYWHYYAVEALYPEKRQVEHFIVDRMHYTFIVDGRRTSHPLTSDPESLTEILRMFDTISYSKGACIVRMMHFTMGNDLFMKSINFYLTRHQFGSVEHQDLWDALSEKSAIEGQFINMTDIMDPWATQMNFPLVTVKVISAGIINVRQERFLNDNSHSPTENPGKYNYRWTIPITIATSADKSNFHKAYTYSDIKWLHHTETEKNINDAIIPGPSVPNSWVIVNLHQTGFYRVNYEEKNWMAIVKHLEANHNDFPPVQRAQIINDAWTLQGLDLVGMKVALRTLNFLKHDIDFVPWRAFARQIDYLDAMLQRNEVYGAFKEFMKTSTQKTYSHYRMDVQEDTVTVDVSQLLRGANFACKYGLPECVGDSLRLYREWMNDTVNKSPDPNLISVILCNGVRYGGAQEWNFAYNQYRNGTRSAIKSDALRGMACSKHPWLIERMLNMALDETKMEPRDGATLISSISLEPAGRDITWNFIKENYAVLANILSDSSISTMISKVSSSFNTEFFLHELKRFSNMTVDFNVYTSLIDGAIQATLKNIDWMTSHHSVIKDWLVELGLSDYLI